MVTISFRNWLIFFIAAVVIVIPQDCNCNFTESSNASHSRVKRFLNFVINGGVAKVVVGGVFPVRFHHKLKRSLNCAVNVQANYVIPPTIIWPVPEDVFKERLNNDFVDNSRPQLYQLLEHMIDGWGRNGRSCVLRTICEVADTPLSHNGMFGEILDVIFTPSETDVMDSEYKQARQYGLHGVSCSRAFSECPDGHGILDVISTVNLFKF
ncbi:uncharacterized protein LOC131680740 [Topomyia yanbarensis]|uniref:uncharacterized protein LOC131680740 n=1 Tax=Topomyia yanbarensis TaxID=2498891 RepID=UPI00273AA75E|nr:uncharacterized protein LOC131680740 [Topomyia yanbarensis]